MDRHTLGRKGTMMTLLERLQHFLEHLRKRPADSCGVYEINEWALLRELLCQYFPPDASGDAGLTNKLLAVLPPATEGDSHAPN